MKDVVVANGMLLVGDRSVPLIAGEIQFWRMEPDSWVHAIETARDAGITVVSTYLSWRRHAPVRGIVDFDGLVDPRLNVRRFLRVCADAGVLVQIKPGPWICAEEPGGGYPDWLLEEEQLLARDDRGEVVVGYNPPFLHPVPSYTNAAYLSAVRRWFTSVWDALGEFAYPRGPIVAIQLDNEPSSCFQDSMYGADYSDSSVAAFRRWLNVKYANSLDELRAAWEDPKIGHFAVTPPRRPASAGERPSRQRLHDWVEFKTEATGAYLSQLRRMHSLLGVGHLLYTVNLVTHPVHDVPVAHAAIRSATDASTGEDHYYIPPLDAGDIHRLARSAATARAAREPLSWVPELQAGIWRSPGIAVDYPDPTPVEQEIWWGAALSLGFTGFNLYMLADRENWQYSPLDAHGNRSDFFAPIDHIVTTAEKAPEALTAEIRASVIVAWHRPDAYDAYTVMGTSRVPDVDWFDAEVARPYRSWDHTLEQLTHYGIVYDLWDTTTDLTADPALPVLIPAHSTLERERIDSLRRSGHQVFELADEPGFVDTLAETTARVVTPSGDRFSETLVGVRTHPNGSVVHVVHWGAGSDDATLILPDHADATLTDVITSTTHTLRQHRLSMHLTAGHQTYVLHRNGTHTPESTASES